jgi:hypothetical protein
MRSKHGCPKQNGEVKPTFESILKSGDLISYLYDWLIKLAEDVFQILITFGGIFCRGSLNFQDLIQAWWNW